MRVEPGQTVKFAEIYRRPAPENSGQAPDIQYWMQANRIIEFRRSLLRWYGKHHRPFPWRMNPTPYRIWISEIMLQQTQAKSAIPYYIRFLDRFPDLASLARATEEEIVRLWSGLGYYNRARNIHKAARQIVESHNGIFPEDYKTVLSLPGIGRYTAGAICSIAFHQARPVVDGNIRRVVARLTGSRSRIPEQYFWDTMAEWVPGKKASAFNQAMMELGSTICLPSHPLCPACPVQKYCLAKMKRLQNSIPPVKPGKAARKVGLAILVIEYRRRILIVRQKGGFIPGEWGLPTRIVPSGQSPVKTAAILNEELFGHRLPISEFTVLNHSITHHRITAHIYTGKATGLDPINVKPNNRMQWADDKQLDAMLTSSLFRKAIQRRRG